MNDITEDRFTTWDFEVIRDDSGLSLSVVYTLKSYSKQTIVSKEFPIDEYGNTDMFEVVEYNEEDLLDTRVVNYIIPDSDRTTCYHSDVHPHDPENELEYQRLSDKWLSDVQQSDDWVQAIEELSVFHGLDPSTFPRPQVIASEYELQQIMEFLEAEENKLANTAGEQIE